MTNQYLAAICRSADLLDRNTFYPSIFYQIFHAANGKASSWKLKLEQFCRNCRMSLGSIFLPLSVTILTLSCNADGGTESPTENGEPIMEARPDELNPACSSQGFSQPPIAAQLPLRIKWYGFWILAVAILLPCGIPVMERVFPGSEMEVRGSAVVGNFALTLAGVIVLAIGWSYGYNRVERLRAGEYLVHWKYDRALLRKLARQKMFHALLHLVIWPSIGGFVWCVYWLCDLTDPVLEPENYGSLAALPWFAGISVGLGVSLTMIGLLRALMFGEMTPHVVIGKTFFYFNNHIHVLAANSEEYPLRIETRNDMQFLVLTSEGRGKTGPIQCEHFIPIPAEWNGQPCLASG